MHSACFSVVKKLKGKQFYISPISSHYTYNGDSAAFYKYSCSRQIFICADIYTYIYIAVLNVAAKEFICLYLALFYE